MHDKQRLSSIKCRSRPSWGWETDIRLLASSAQRLRDQDGSECCTENAESGRLQQRMAMALQVAWVTKSGQSDVEQPLARRACTRSRPTLTTALWQLCRWRG